MDGAPLKVLLLNRGRMDGALAVHVRCAETGIKVLPVAEDCGADCVVPGVPSIGVVVLTGADLSDGGATEAARRRLLELQGRFEVAAAFLLAGGGGRGGDDDLPPGSLCQLQAGLPPGRLMLSIAVDAGDCLAQLSRVAAAATNRELRRQQHAYCRKVHEEATAPGEGMAHVLRFLREEKRVADVDCALLSDQYGSLRALASQRAEDILTDCPVARETVEHLQALLQLP